MIYQCFNRCFEHQAKYSVNLSDVEPCPKCKERRFWFLHFGFFGKPNYEMLLNIETGEQLTPDIEIVRDWER